MYKNTGYAFCSIIALVFATASFADELRFDRKADWDTWTTPQGTLQFNADGSIGLNRIDKKINAVPNAPNFLHRVKSSKNLQPGGVHVVGSSAEMGDNIIDGRTDTWWAPDPDTVLEDWFIEVDLGRLTLATKIRLTFADTLDFEPFRQFSVYVNDGVRSVAHARDAVQLSVEPGAVVRSEPRALLAHGVEDRVEFVARDEPCRVGF